MKRAVYALCALLALAQPFAYAQQNVQTIGPVTPGNIPVYNSPTIVKDSGFSPSTIIGAVCASPKLGNVLYYTGTQWICQNTGYITLEAFGGGTGVSDNTAALTAARSFPAAVLIILPARKLR